MKLRKTALILLLVAGVGTAFVILDYVNGLKRQAESGRPPHVGRLERNFAAVDHDKQAVFLSDLEGKVWFLATVCLSQPGKSTENLRILREVAAKYPERDDLHFVCMTVDPDHDLPEKMDAFAGELGLADDPRWWFVAAGETPTRRFLKDKLKFGAVTETEVEGRAVVVFDSIIGILDHNRNLRGRYDFAEARRVQDKSRALLAEDPAAYDGLNDEHKQVIDRSLKAVDLLEGHFFDALDYIINEKDGTLPQES